MTPRRIVKVEHASLFEKNFERLPKTIRKLAVNKDMLFRQDAFRPSLETHKLGGKLKNDWAYSINKDYRIHFYFVSDNVVVYLNIGTHEIYKK
ncbi:MAG: Plasmid stabilization system [Candidatus Giovannonibacteria bacterium GW2011_GWA2_44_13b]|uniref:Plasmid stabilization system n=1 Tax=Candidatus Giovannonibacteria bacterium GW2011_GWA2_44_13b TaxID=1618647 RepID=A0A0G1JXD4_9BACT|nr:MAG: Plasmid stabilization system [Candidatus Giovannonibacteria bacterium GW2011_GWA2_44_13b]